MLSKYSGTDCVREEKCMQVILFEFTYFCLYKSNSIYHRLWCKAFLRFSEFRNANRSVHKKKTNQKKKTQFQKHAIEN